MPHVFLSLPLVQDDAGSKKKINLLRIFTTQDCWDATSLVVSYIYLVFADSTAIVEKQDGVKTLNPRQPQKD